MGDSWIVRGVIEEGKLWSGQRPVLTGEQTKITPRRWLARIAEYMRQQLKADAAYAAALCHNPISKASQGRAGWPLAKMSSYIPAGWRG